MAVNDLSRLNAGEPRRISFSQASALLVAQALTDANERLVHHFPALSSATWGDVLRQLQPDLLIDGQAVAFDWPGLARRAQNLAVFPRVPALSPATGESGLPELGEQSIPYQQQAIRALAELRETPGAQSLLAYVLLTDLARDKAGAASVSDVPQGRGQQPAGNLRPATNEGLVPLPGADDKTAGSFAARMGGGGLAPVPVLEQKNTPTRVSRRNASKRRTFRDIIEHHPRGNGKFGFTVRELCATMRISAASLTDARENPGRLSINAVVALAEAMGENPMQVFVDLLVEAGTKKKNKQKRWGTQLQRPKNSSLR